MSLLNVHFFSDKMRRLSGTSILWDLPRVESLCTLPPQEAHLEKMIEVHELIWGTILGNSSKVRK